MIIALLASWDMLATRDEIIHRLRMKLSSHQVKPGFITSSETQKILGLSRDRVVDLRKFNKLEGITVWGVPYYSAESVEKLFNSDIYYSIRG
jgi:hypothetical protein